MCEVEPVAALVQCRGEGCGVTAPGRPSARETGEMMVIEVYLDEGSPPAGCPLTVSFGWEGSPTKIGYQKKKGTLIVTFLLEDLVDVSFFEGTFSMGSDQGKALL